MKTTKVRIATLSQYKSEKRPVVMVTAYDYITGRLADEAGVDVVLVGDSLGNAVLGFDSTIPVTLDMMVHHSAAVRRGVRRALLVADMPFLTTKVTPEDTLRNAGRLMQEAGAEAVKLEGGREAVPHVERLVGAGIPVMGHIGLLPQSVHATSGYRVQGRDDAKRQRLLEDARALEDAGCFSVVLECMVPDLAAAITRSLCIPTIGIGAGGACDGQVLVLADLAGLSFEKPPKFVRQFGNTGEVIRNAIAQYADAVRLRVFPEKQQEYK